MNNLHTYHILNMVAEVAFNEVDKVWGILTGDNSVIEVSETHLNLPAFEYMNLHNIKPRDLAESLTLSELGRWLIECDNHYPKGSNV